MKTTSKKLYELPKTPDKKYYLYPVIITLKMKREIEAQNIIKILKGRGKSSTLKGEIGYFAGFKFIESK